MKLIERCFASLGAALVLSLGFIALTWPFILAFTVLHFVIKFW